MPLASPRRHVAALMACPYAKGRASCQTFLVRVQWGGAAPERDLLLELKTLHFGASTYPAGATARCHAVARRAAALLREYAAKARQVDQKYCGSAPHETGPVAARLRGYDAVKGLVFGAFGETSPDVHKLLSSVVQIGARHHYRKMRARDPDEARGALAWMLKRRWGISAVRAHARLTLARLEHVGRGAGQAVVRRIAAEGTAARARRAFCCGTRGPNVGSGRRPF